MENFGLMNFIIDVLGVVFSGILAFFAIIWIYRNQNNDSVTSKTISCLTDIFPEYKETMKKINDALESSKKLVQYFEKCEQEKRNFSDFNKEYYSEKYDSLRDVHYFFELLGSLIRQKKLINI
jgi:hypothetical protein